MGGRTLVRVDLYASTLYQGTMQSEVPYEWQLVPPESVVVGVGTYTRALASILGTIVLPFDRLHAGPAPNAGGGYPRVLENVRQVLLVVPEDMAPADAMRCHRAVWGWIEKLSSAGDQHDLRFLFILPETASAGYEEALAVGLCVPVIDPATTGHAVWHRSGELSTLLKLIAAIRPMDIVRLKARRFADRRRRALAGLRIAVMGDAPETVLAAVLAVLDAFRGMEYHLDLFCRPPSHRHGNLLRGWLNAGVTGPVTQDWCAIGRGQLPAWLAD